MEFKPYIILRSRLPHPPLETINYVNELIYSLLNPLLKEIQYHAIIQFAEIDEMILQEHIYDKQEYFEWKQFADPT